MPEIVVPDSEVPDIRAAIVAEARSWIGTPWSHQQRRKGIAVDCVGLITEVPRALGLSTFDLRNYDRQPNGTLLGICRAQMIEIPPSTMQPGDVVALAYAGEPMHVGIVAPYPYGVNLALIHASNERRAVCEHRLDAPLRRLIIAAFRLPGVPA